MMSTSIISSLIHAANDALFAAMETELDSNDETRAGLVRIGKFQDNPTKYGLAILTHSNDPDNPGTWLHSALGAGGLTLHVQSDLLPPYQIGGGEFWYRRFTTQIVFFCKPTATRDRASDLANIILRRAEHTLKNVDFSSIGPDSFGESPMVLHLAQSENLENGGVGQFIYKGFVKWQVLTEML